MNKKKIMFWATARLEAILLFAIFLLMLGWLFIGLPIYLIMEPENKASLLNFTTTFFAIITGLVGIYAILSIIVYGIYLNKLNKKERCES